MKPKYWKYTFDIRQNKVAVYRHIVEGNNPRFLKPPKRPSEQKREFVEEFEVSIPFEEFEAFRKWTDYGAWSVSERDGVTSLGVQKRLNQSVVSQLRDELSKKYPLLPL